MTPFKLVYGRDPPQLLTYYSNDQDPPDIQHLLQQRDRVLIQLKQNLLKAQGRMKLMAERKRTEISFTGGDCVFVKLQPYRQHSLDLRKKIRNWKYVTLSLLKFFTRLGMLHTNYNCHLKPDCILYFMFHYSKNALVILRKWPPWFLCHYLQMNMTHCCNLKGSFNFVLYSGMDNKYNCW